jgi:hypothetical protein
MSNLQPEARPGDYDDVTRLRLQLHQAELQRDAFEKALKADVMRIVKHAISMSMVAIEKHVADTLGCQLVERDDLKAENARLKAEIERLTELFRKTERLMLVDGEYEAVKAGTVASLKAEVERLEEGNECLDQMHEKEMARSAFLYEQVERLTKAVASSPVAQAKLKELEGKTTFEEINPKEVQS